jgi:NADP-dependent 3-hydroxy acid dehydrogenase YdfG
MQNEHGLVARGAERLFQLAEEIERAGGVALAIPADLASEAERDRVVAAVRERWRRIDILKRRGGLVRLVR